MSTARVIVASTRAAAGTYEDTSGPAAVEFLRRMGLDTPEATVVPDAEIGRAVREALASQPAVLITSGGTGLTPDDLTVETIAPLLDKELPGITQEFFRRGLASTPTAILSGAVAGLAGNTFVMALPGSPGGVKDGCAVLEPVLPHILELTSGATDTHPPADPDYVAEQTGLVVETVIQDSPLENLAARATEATLTQAMGALVRFDGIVRDHDGGERVAALAYESHPSAPDELRRVCEEVAAEHPVRIFAAHRTGEVPIGELAFLVLTAAAHRGDAFHACQKVADRVKAEVPIWKEQTLANGTSHWVGING